MASGDFGRARGEIINILQLDESSKWSFREVSSRVLVGGITVPIQVGQWGRGFQSVCRGNGRGSLYEVRRGKKGGMQTSRIPDS